MKKFFMIFLCTVFILPLLPAPAFAAERIGVVDFEVLQEKSVEFQKVRDQLQKKAEELKAKLTKESNELGKLEEEYHKQSMMLSLDAQESKRKELERKRRHYNYLFEEYNRELREAELEATRTMARRVRAVLGDIGKAGGFTIILDKDSPGLLYDGGAEDITGEVARAMDKSR